MVTQTRYMRSDSHTINTLTKKKLLTSQSGVSGFTASIGDGDVTVQWGIRVWKVIVSGGLTEITSGTPIAVVSRSTNGSGIQSATWACPSRVLVATDAILVRVYFKFGALDWELLPEFITEQLNATALNATTWTVYYYTYRNYSAGLDTTTGRLYYDTVTYDSKITNFSIVAPVLVTVADSIALSDSVKRHKSLKVSDNIGLSDVSRTHKTFHISDSISLAETVAVLILKLVTDSISLTDVVSTDKSLIVTDLVSLADVPLVSKPVFVSDGITLNDVVFRGKFIFIEDSILLSDVVLTHKTLSVLDLLTLFDVVLTDKAVVVVDSIGIISETVTVTVEGVPVHKFLVPMIRMVGKPLSLGKLLRDVMAVPREGL